MTAKAFDTVRLDDGRLPSHAWPGAYPVVYLDGENETLCPKCANDADRSDEWDEQQQPQLWFIHWEGAPEICAQCNGVIESAYGDYEGEGEGFEPDDERRGDGR